MLADSITEHRLGLRAADFDPLPDHGKECFLTGWTTKTNVSDTDIRGWQSLAASRNTGILCKHTPALDLDILNPDAADAVEALLRLRVSGELLVRTGLPPKRLIPFRTDKPFSKITAKLISADGTIEKLEFLGDGQQFVAFGTHPDTRQPYTWKGGEPGQVPRSALPLIDQEGALELINAATELLITKFGYRRVETNKGCPTGAVPIHSGDPVVVSNWTAALWMMNAVDWNGDSDGWFKLATACKAAGISLSEFSRWSRKDPDYANDEEEIEQRWESIGPVYGGKPIHDGALRAALKARGIQLGSTHTVGLPSHRRRWSTINWQARLNSVLNKLAAKRDGDMLFWAACRVAEIMADTGMPQPSVAVELLVGRAYPVIGREEAQRVIGNAFNVVEKQILVSKFATPTAPRVDVHGTAVMRREARSGDWCPF